MARRSKTVPQRPGNHAFAMALAGTDAMSLHETPQWGTTRQLTDRYPLARTRAYELLAQGKLRAKRLGRRTIWNFESADELFNGLPDVGREV
jgi:hypothetical protein